jgi:alpha-galactosidase
MGVLDASFLPLVAGFMLMFMGCGYTLLPYRVPYNDLAKTPPMGWNSWNRFATRIDDQTVRTIADAMVSTGMRDAGYVYVNIDDSWQGARDAQGNLTSNDKFPDMKGLADFITLYTQKA